MSVAENMGAYMAGRFAGRMSASVDAKNELDREKRIATRAIDIALADMKELKALVRDGAASFVFESCKNAGFAAVRDELDAEAVRIADEFAAHGAVTEAKFAEIAPFSFERRLPHSERIRSVQTARSAAFAHLEQCKFEHFGIPRGSDTDANLRARISQWLEDFYR